jgi:hypothetical protein
MLLPCETRLLCARLSFRCMALFGSRSAPLSGFVERGLAVGGGLYVEAVARNPAAQIRRSRSAPIRLPSPAAINRRTTSSQRPNIGIPFARQRRSLPFSSSHSSSTLTISPTDQGRSVMPAACPSPGPLVSHSFRDSPRAGARLSTHHGKPPSQNASSRRNHCSPKIASPFSTPSAHTGNQAGPKA